MICRGSPEGGQQSCHNKSSYTWYRVLYPTVNSNYFSTKHQYFFIIKNKCFLWGMHCICVCYMDENHTSFDWTVNQISELLASNLGYQICTATCPARAYYHTVVVNKVWQPRMLHNRNQSTMHKATMNSHTVNFRIMTLCCLVCEYHSFKLHITSIFMAV
jgi:hypothetical protein